jgi:hypothetical protein
MAQGDVDDIFNSKGSQLKPMASKAAIRVSSSVYFVPFPVMRNLRADLNVLQKS